MRTPRDRTEIFLLLAIGLSVIGAVLAFFTLIAPAFAEEDADRFERECRQQVRKDFVEQCTEQRKRTRAQGKAAAEKHAAYLAEQERDRRAADEADIAQKKKCGRDYQRLDLGMQIERVSECAFPARRVGASETPNGRVYFYRVSRTHVTTDAKGRIIQIFQ